MPVIQHTIVYRGPVDKLYAFLRDLPVRASDNAALQVRLGNVVLGLVHQAFVVKARGGTDAAGLRWKPLAPYTLARRRRGPGGLKSTEILRDTGLLLNSIKSRATSPGALTPATVPEQVFRLQPGEVIIGTSRPWAWAHHVGLPYRHPPLPQRRLWPEVSHWPANWWQDIREQAVQGIVDIVLDHLTRGIP